MKNYTMNKSVIALGFAAAAIFGATARQTVETATDSIRQIYVRAQQGEAVDQNEVGGWYYRGRHVEQNYEEALQWWTKAAAQNNALAIGNMALCYQTGNGIARDSVRAVKLYMRSIREGNTALVDAMEHSASEGNVFAAVLMASCYGGGVGVQRDIDKQIEYLRIAAEKGSLDSQTRLALAYLNKNDRQNAFSWFERASRGDDVNATYFAGKLLLEGRGVRADKNEAANYLLKAAREGHANAMYLLAQCYINGDGVTRNAQQGSLWLSRACGKGLHKAEWALAKNYLDGTGVPESYDRAMYYFGRSLDGSYSRTFARFVNDTIPESSFVTYLKGMKAYTTRDFSEAMDIFKELARADRAEGELMQGVILCNSDYEKNNLRKGVRHIRKAAETDAQAMFILGGLHEAGRGVDQNIGETVRLYTAAAEAGFGPAQCALADMYFEGRGVDQDYAKAVQLYTDAYESGQINVNAARRLADCYENGWGGLEQDAEKAARLNDGDYSSRTSELLRLI